MGTDVWGASLDQDLALVIYELNTTRVKKRQEATERQKETRGSAKEHQCALKGCYRAQKSATT